jgi:hypothetical protein
MVWGRGRGAGNVPRRWGTALALCAGSVLPVTDTLARDRNPWIAPEPRASSPGVPPAADTRFVAPEYDPTRIERRGRAGDALRTQPGIRWDESWAPPGGLYAPPAWGAGTPSVPVPGTSLPPGPPGSTGPDLTAIPGLSTSPWLLPYGTLPGTGLLYPGTGLMYPGSGLLYPGSGLGLSPLYGSPLGGIPLFGLPY